MVLKNISYRKLIDVCLKTSIILKLILEHFVIEKILFVMKIENIFLLHFFHGNNFISISSGRK